MNDTIYKYELEITTKQTLKLRGENPEIRTVTKQDGKLVLYAEVETGRNYFTKEVDIIIVGTGENYPIDRDKLSYVGTVPLEGFVWHIFYVK